jgi:hypothetical protein
MRDLYAANQVKINIFTSSPLAQQYLYLLGFRNFVPENLNLGPTRPGLVQKNGTNIFHAHEGDNGHGDIEVETWKHGDIDMETWKHGERETWRHTDMETSDGKK